MVPALLVALLLSGEQLPASARLFEPDLAVELELRFARPSRADADARWAALQAALKAPRVVRVLRPRGGDAPQPLPPVPSVLSRHSPCLGEALARGSLRVLVSWRRGADGALQPLLGVEQEQGRWTDLDPEWPRLLAAAEEVLSWNEERMRAVGEAALFVGQKAALASDNPFLRGLAAEWLVTHGSAAAVDQAWGAPGSAARRDAEARARVPQPKGCRAP